jgi:hypothetical protein
MLRTAFHRVFSLSSLLSLTDLRACPPGQPSTGDSEINRSPSSIPGRWPDEKMDPIGSGHQLIAVAKENQARSDESVPVNC